MRLILLLSILWWTHCFAISETDGIYRFTTHRGDTYIGRAKEPGPLDSNITIYLKSGGSISIDRYSVAKKEEIEPSSAEKARQEKAEQEDAAEYAAIEKARQGMIKNLDKLKDAEEAVKHLMINTNINCDRFQESKIIP